jgi:hypothetical protein
MAARFRYAVVGGSAWFACVASAINLCLPSTTASWHRRKFSSTLRRGSGVCCTIFDKTRARAMLYLSFSVDAVKPVECGAGVDFVSMFGYISLEDGSDKGNRKSARLFAMCLLAAGEPQGEIP